MKQIALSLLFAALASSASAACFADYKAKRDNPLKLHYGVIELPDAACGSVDAAETYLRDSGRLADWTLLNVLSVFDEAGLEERKDSAGDFFLRF